MCKLHKGEFCALYFLTNKGLVEAEALSHLVDNEVPSIVQDENSLHSFIPTGQLGLKTLSLMMRI
jgi:hypothetical protein